MTCPVCGSEKIEIFLHRQDVPVHQNLICHDKKSALELRRGDLSMAVCHKCGFIFNRDFNPALLSYCEDYDNTQTSSRVFTDYISDRLSYLINDKNVRGCKIIEVGCGKGYFLRKLVEEGEGNTGIGFDPSYNGELVDLYGRLRFERKFYDAGCSDIKADVVICRHVIEHVQDPVNLLKSVHEALSRSPGARVFFETPSFDWIFDNKVLWDFFYEHCSLFNAASLSTAFQVAGFEVLAIQHVFGGQYLWIEAKRRETIQKVSFDPGNSVERAKAHGKIEAALKDSWEEKIDSVKREGPIAVWGAGAKGVTFLNLVDPKNEKIAYVIDINPNKQGKFIPGTEHEIIAPKLIKEKKIRSIILMNPNYEIENRRMIQDMHLSIKWL